MTTQQKNILQKPVKKERLHERVVRHIKDINSEITDEDIRDVEIELELMTDLSADVDALKEKQQNS